MNKLLDLIRDILGFKRDTIKSAVKCFNKAQLEIDSAVGLFNKTVNSINKANTLFEESIKQNNSAVNKYLKLIKEAESQVDTAKNKINANEELKTKLEDFIPKV